MLIRRPLLGLTTSIVAVVLVSAYGLIPISVVFAEGEEIPPPAVIETPPTVIDTPPTENLPVVETPPIETPPEVLPVVDPVIVPPVVPGPSSPVGPSADTYTYNSATGLWENSHYTWDPVTKQTKPKDQQAYSFNPATGHWDTTEWVFVPETGTYQANVVSAPAPELTQEQQQLVDSLPDVQGALLKALLLPSAVQGPGADSSITSTSSNTGFFDLFHNASISNRLDSTATTGDAIVTSNTLGGSATSGDAQAVANLFNALNSSLGFLGAGSPLFFTANILGNLLGDLLINPGELPNTSNATQQSTTADNNLHVQAQNTGTINNDINLTANSGAATVANNTQAGSATSGNALAMANVMNAINSSIGSGQSFMGMINIYGNLNGDILLPPGFINSLLASNAQAPATNVLVTDPYNTDLQSVTTNTINANLNDTNTINNNLAVTATSGGALVSDNTSAGNSTTGSASTNVTLLNLTGKQIVGKNALLVFVNVLGSWVGLIMNAPNGVTAGAIGDSGASIGNLASSVQNNTADITSNTVNTINNNLNVSADTGDASVIDNTLAGNATSGDALAAVNILNVSNSTLSLSDWFGILFINVLGTWYGSFGVDTDAGNPINTPAVVPFIGESTSSSPQVFSFVPPTSTRVVSSGNSATEPEITTVLSETSDGSGPTATAIKTVDVQNRGMSVPWMLFALVLILLILFGDKARNYAATLRLNKA